ncbi:hypothetical protein [Sphingomonas glaciei]|uniref:LPXTG cell wall anchor domain-containing protein n=1 Tax=Sphingomonas glaciei TaxID=2938948 RepID=A0ABY5MWU5_9SPHN|nr:hypothetical protein [Sphingomonas glaciei]UUR07608.1 hypothetical protein M1K48_11795 [Sphingomonas glaciei]
MTRHLLVLLAGLWLGLPAPAAAQNNAAPANVVVPAPPPREGTVGPEQLRDFALPGTRQPSAPPTQAPRPAPAPAVAPPPVQRTTPSPPAAAVRPAPGTTERAAPARAAGETATRETDAAPVATSVAPPVPETTAVVPSDPVASPQAGTRLPPIAVTQSGSQASSLVPGWWPWLLVAILGGVGLALVWRQRRRPALAGYADDEYERVAAEPSPRPDPAPVPLPRPTPTPEALALPTGLVTTRLRQPARMPEARAPAAAPPPPSGGVVSTRLRGWIEIDLAVREILFDGEGAIFRVDLVVANSGSSAARDIALEAVATNGGDAQAAELANFFARPAAPRTALAELGPLSDDMISHELRMPRAAIRAYELGGKPTFVPVIAVTAAYRVGSGEGRTGAAFLVGRTVQGSEKLAPLLLPPGPGRLLGLGVRRLDEAVRR